jgi:hypothetical protein
MLLEAKLSPMNLGEQRICNRIAESEEDQDTSAFGTNPFSLSIRLPVPAPPLIFGGPSILLVFGNLHCKN